MIINNTIVLSLYDDTCFFTSISMIKNFKIINFRHLSFIEETNVDYHVRIGGDVACVIFCIVMIRLTTFFLSLKSCV